jgi:hypothetical protein
VNPRFHLIPPQRELLCCVCLTSTVPARDQELLGGVRTLLVCFAGVSGSHRAQVDPKTDGRKDGGDVESGWGSPCPGHYLPIPFPHSAPGWTWVLPPKSLI